MRLSCTQTKQMIFIQKCKAKAPLLTKGPLALFYGGQEIIPFLSTDSTKSSNKSMMILVVLSPVLQLLLQLYKKVKFRKAIKIEQQLQQAVMSGVRNVYGSIVIFIGFIGFLGAALVHLYVSEQIQNSEELTEKNMFAPIFWLTCTFSAMICVAFLRNPKLRFVCIFQI